MGVVGSHKGSAGLLTTVIGKACHSSRPTHGVNAIFSAPDNDSPFELPYTSVSVGVIHGGTARNAVAGDCAFQWDIRATKSGVVNRSL
jgi:acetylornithine deacetylase